MSYTITVGTGSGGQGASYVSTTTHWTGDTIGTADLEEALEYNPNSPCVSALVTVNGNTTVTVPAKAAGVIITPAVGNTTDITLKGVAGDTGIVLGNVACTKLSFDTTPPASFVLSTGSSITVGVKFY